MLEKPSVKQGREREREGGGRERERKGEMERERKDSTKNSKDTNVNSEFAPRENCRYLQSETFLWPQFLQNVREN